MTGGFLLELLGELLAWRNAPHWATAAGVAWLVVQERRERRRRRKLEATVQTLRAGHAGDVNAHRNLPAALQEVDHAHAHAAHH